MNPIKRKQNENARKRQKKEKQLEELRIFQKLEEEMNKQEKE